MDKSKLITTLVAAFFVIGIGLAPFVTDSLHADQVKWMKYDQALEMARAEQKHVIVNFTTSWCGWCKKMKATTYEDSEVLANLNDNFVAAKVDGDSYDVVELTDGQITEKGLTRQYGVTGYPTTWFLEPDGTHIAPAPGYVDATAMNYILHYVGSNLNESMAFSDYITQRKKLEAIRPDAQLKPGMTESEVRLSWGEPESVTNGDDEKLLHYDGDHGLVFKDGILVAYRDVASEPKASN